MKTLLTALVLVAGLAACEQRDRETGRVEGAESVDTSVITRSTQDTMIVERDTQIDVDVDTTVKEGDVRTRDTLNR